MAYRYSTAVTDDLRRMERASNRSSRFFDQWLRRPGYPIVEAA